MAKTQPTPITISTLQGINLGVTFSIGVTLFCLVVVPLFLFALYSLGASFPTFTPVLPQVQ